MNKKVYWILGLMVAVYVVTLSYLSIRKHLAFASGYDLANMDQTVWETSRGNIFQLSGAKGLVSRFNFHADIILVLLAPIYWIWNNVAAILFVQALFLGLAAIPIFLLAKKYLKNELLALSLALIYLLNPGVMWTSIYDFHPVSMAIFFVLMCLYFGLEKRWKWALIMAVLAMMTKENVPLLIGVVGLILMVVEREYAKAFGLMVLAGLWFGLMVFVVMPWSNQGASHWVWEWYVKPQSASSATLKTYTDILVRSDTITYYQDLLRPWGYLPILGFPALILAGPQLLINVMSTHGQMKSITMHYDTMVIPGLVLGIILAFWLIQKILQKFKLDSRLVFLPILFVLIMAARDNYHYSPLPTTPGHWKLMYNIGEDERNFSKLLKTVPADASITASSEVRPHLTHRVYASNLPHNIETADYIAIVDQNRLVGDYNMKDFDYDLAMRLKADEKMELMGNYGHFWLFRRR